MMARPKAAQKPVRMTVKLADAPTPKVEAANLMAVKDDGPPAVSVTALHEAADRAIQDATLTVEDRQSIEAAANLEKLAALNRIVDRPLFERNESGVITLSEAARSYRTLPFDRPLLAIVDGEEVVLLPSGFVLMVHPDGNASCTIEGRSYTYGTEGAVLVPEELEGSLTSHGFRRL
jgi:hypothetical protein